MACPRDKFSSYLAATTCLACAAGKSASTPGSTSASMCNVTISELNQGGDQIFNQGGDQIWRVDFQRILPALVLAAAALCILACIASVRRYRAWARCAGRCQDKGDVEMRAIEHGSASLLHSAEVNEDFPVEIEMHEIAPGRAAEDVIPEGDAGGGVGGVEGGGRGNGGGGLNDEKSKAAALVAAGTASSDIEEQQAASVSASSRMAAGVAGAAARAIDVILRPTDALMRAFDDGEAEHPVSEAVGAPGAPESGDIRASSSFLEVGAAGRKAHGDGGMAASAAGAASGAGVQQSAERKQTDKLAVEAEAAAPPSLCIAVSGGERQSGGRRAAAAAASAALDVVLRPTSVLMRAFEDAPPRVHEENREGIEEEFG